MEGSINRRIAQLRRELAHVAEAEQALLEPAATKAHAAERSLREAFFDTTGRFSATQQQKLQQHEPKDFVAENRRTVRVKRRKRRPPAGWNKEGKAAAPAAGTVEEKVLAFERMRDAATQRRTKRGALVQSAPELPTVARSGGVKKQPRKNQPAKAKRRALPKMQDKVLAQALEQQRQLDAQHSAEIRQLRRELQFDAPLETPAAVAAALKAPARVAQAMGNVALHVPNVFIEPVLRFWIRSYLRAGFSRWKRTTSRLAALEEYYRQHIRHVRRVQAWARGNRGREMLNELMAARSAARKRFRCDQSMRIQSTWRRFKARQDFKALVLQRRERWRERLSTTSQRCWRGHRARRAAWARLRDEVKDLVQAWLGSRTTVSRALLLLETSLQKEPKAGGNMARLRRGERKLVLLTLKCMVDSKARVPQMRGAVLTTLLCGRRVLTLLRQCSPAVREAAAAAAKARRELVAEQEHAEKLAREQRRRDKMRRDEQRAARGKAQDLERRQERERAATEERQIHAARHAEHAARESQELEARKTREAQRRLALQRQEIGREFDEKIAVLTRRHEQAVRSVRDQAAQERLAREAEWLPAQLQQLSCDLGRDKLQIRATLEALERERTRIEGELAEASRTESLKVDSARSKAREAWALRADKGEGPVREALEAELDNAVAAIRLSFRQRRAALQQELVGLLERHDAAQAAQSALETRRMEGEAALRRECAVALAAIETRAAEQMACLESANEAALAACEQERRAALAGL